MENQPDLPQTDDEIDLRQVYGALRRRKLIAKITASTILLSGIYVY